MKFFFPPFDCVTIKTAPTPRECKEVFHVFQGSETWCDCTSAVG